jgi:2-dehydro-3-deoxygalactonokinase
MRGEETQIVGAMHATATAEGLSAPRAFVLPGTHSKWVTAHASGIGAPSTFMTGELHAAVLSATIVGRLADSASGSGSAVLGDAFDLAVRHAHASSLGPLHTLFSARTRVLLGRLAGREVSDFVSGLMIGEELRVMLPLHASTPAVPLTLIGAPALTMRYGRALTLSGRPWIDAGPDCALDGLRAVARGLGWLAGQR